MGRALFDEFSNPLDVQVRISGIFVHCYTWKLCGRNTKKWLSESHENTNPTNAKTGIILLGILFSVIFVNLYCLYNRLLEINMIITILLLVTGYLLLKGKPKTDVRSLWYKLFDLGSFFLVLGLFIEPFQEGIKRTMPRSAISL